MIKCIGFLKSLKQLFIILLISCFTLLVGSSVKAWDSYGVNGSTTSCNLYLDDVGEINGFSEGYNVNITSLGNLWTYSDLGNNNIFYIYSNNNRRMWAWINGKLYHNSYSYYSTVLPASKLQGYIDKIKVVDSSCLDDYSCVSQFNDYSTGNIITNDEFSNLDLTFVKYGVFTTNGQSNNCSLNPSIIFGGLVFLASDGNFYSVACQGGRDYPSYCPSGIITGSSLGLDSDLNYENLLNYTFSISPFGSSSSSGVINPIITGNLVESKPYTNGEIVKGFECAGLQPSLCYGGFPINNIFEPSEQFEDFTGYLVGQGATVFDLYNLYSGSFSSLNQFLKTVLARYKNGQINSFKTEPKALLMLGAQMNTAGINVDYISEYCTLLLNENSSDIYTGNTPGSLRARQCLRSEKTKDSFKNGSGLDVDFLTTTGGIFGDSEDVDFDPDTFFSSILDRITTGLDKNLSLGVVGLIPGYIVLFTLALIFIRLISH